MASICTVGSVQAASCINPRRRLPAPLTATAISGRSQSRRRADSIESARLGGWEAERAERLGGLRGLGGLKVEGGLEFGIWGLEVLVECFVSTRVLGWAAGIEVEDRDLRITGLSSFDVFSASSKCARGLLVFHSR